MESTTKKKEEEDELTLRSPMGTAPMVYAWPLKKGKGSLRRSEDKQDEAAEIVETIRWVCEDLSAIKEFMDASNLLNTYNPNSFESMTELCNTYNKAVEKYVINDLPQVKDRKTDVSRAHLRHIIQKCYNKSVSDPNLLNHYEAFTPEVYGETSFELICQILDKLHPIGPENKFVDLGSGVGQVVLQVAALSECSHCLGIEKSNIPAKYAQDLEKWFRFWMDFYGKKYSDFKIVHGDFLDQKYRSEILESTIVFVNNFAFGPEVDQQLKYIFADLNDGARIFSSKSFCALNFRISERNLSDIGTIMHVSKMDPLKGSVSWTGKPVSYYLHVIDRAKLERFFLKNAASKKGGGPASSSGGAETHSSAGARKKLSLKSLDISEESSATSTSRSSSAERETTHSLLDMTTTRKAWSEQIKSESNLEDSPAIPIVKTRRKGPRRTMKTPKALDLASFSSSSNASSSSSSPPLPPPPPPPATPEPTPPSRPQRTAVANAAAISALEGQEEQDFLEEPSGGGSAYRKRASRIKKNPSSALQQDTQMSPSESPDEKTKRRSRSSKISGLDFLHNQTLNSIRKSNEDRTAPAGCINLYLEKKSTPELLQHVEIPVSLNVDENGDPISYELKLYLQKCKKNFMDFMSTMKNPQFKVRVSEELAEEKKRNAELLARKKQLSAQVENLLNESLSILKGRLRELNITANSPPEFIEKAKDIVAIHHELQNKRKSIEEEVRKIQEENENLIFSKEKELTEQLMKLRGYNFNEAKDIVRREIEGVVKSASSMGSSTAMMGSSSSIAIPLLPIKTEDMSPEGPVSLSCIKKEVGVGPPGMTPLLNKLSDVTFTKCPPPSEETSGGHKRSKEHHHLPPHNYHPKHKDWHDKRTHKQHPAWSESVTIEARPYDKGTTTTTTTNILSPRGVEVRRIESPAASYDLSPTKVLSSASSTRLVDLPKIDLAQSMQAVNGSRADIILHPDSRSNSSEHIEGTNFAKSKVCTTPRAEQFQDRLKTIIHSVLSADEESKTSSSSSSGRLLPLSSLQQQSHKRQQHPLNLQQQHHHHPQQQYHPPPPPQSSRTMNDLIQSEIEKSLSNNNNNSGGGRPRHHHHPHMPPHSAISSQLHPPTTAPSSMSRMSRVIEDSIRSQIESNDLEGLACPRSSRSPEYYKRGPGDYHPPPSSSSSSQPIRPQQQQLQQQQQVIPPSYQMEGLAARYYEQSRKRSNSPTLPTSPAILPPKKQHLEERASSAYRQHGPSSMPSSHNSLPPKEETTKRWQDEISTGFDRLVAYATEVVDKRRKSSDSSSPGHLNSSPSIGVVGIESRKEVVLVPPSPSPEFDNRMSTLGVKFKGAAGYRDSNKSSGVVVPPPLLMSPPLKNLPGSNELVRIPTPGSSSSRAGTPASSTGSRGPTPRAKSPLPGENLPEHHPKKRYFAESRLSAAEAARRNAHIHHDPYGKYLSNPTVLPPPHSGLGGTDPYSLPQQPQMMNPSAGSSR